MAEPDVGSARRYFLLKRHAALSEQSPTLAGVWRWRQEQEPATPLPAGFPFAELLAAAGYTAEEDLRGADADELLLAIPSLSSSDADSVLATRDALFEEP